MASTLPFIPKPGDIDHNNLLEPVNDWVKQRITEVYTANDAEVLSSALENFITSVEEDRSITTNGETVSFNQYKAALENLISSTTEADVEFISIDFTPDDVDEPKLVSFNNLQKPCD